MKSHMKLKLSDPQLKKLAMGEGVVVKPSHVCESSGHPIMMHKRTINTIVAKHNKGKSHILKLSPAEMKLNKIEIVEGGRIRWGHLGRIVGKATKKALEYYREHIRPEIGPTLRKLVTDTTTKVLPKIATAAVTALGGPTIGALADPFINNVAEEYSEPIADKVSKLTGAYGLPPTKVTYGKTLPAGHQQLKPNVEANQRDHTINLVCPHCKKAGGALFLAKGGSMKRGIHGGALFL